MESAQGKENKMKEKKYRNTAMEDKGSEETFFFVGVRLKKLVES